MTAKPISTWMDVTDDLPIDVKVGQTLTYDFEGSELNLKIMRIRHGKIWAKSIILYRPDEVQVKDIPA